MFGDKLFGKHSGYPTPAETPGDMTCLLLKLPAAPSWWAVYVGLLQVLTEESAWQQFEGGITPEQAAHCAQEIYDTAMELASTSSDCPVLPEYPTPYWDESSDLEDEGDAEEQTWYGRVEYPEAPASELSLIDDVAIWTLTGFIAYSGDIGAAIFFHTIAPAFVLAWRRGDVGEVIRIVVDGADYGRVDTTSTAAGELLNFPVLAGDGGQDILMMKVS
jgi:hypothetical protein